MKYTQSDGLAMGASLPAILSNLWMKPYEKLLQKPNEGRERKTPEVKSFVDDRVYTVKGNPPDYPEYAISLHPN